jgi:hypothetical protein
VKPLFSKCESPVTGPDKYHVTSRAVVLRVGAALKVENPVRHLPLTFAGSAAYW